MISKTDQDAIDRLRERAETHPVNPVEILERPISLRPYTLAMHPFFCCYMVERSTMPSGLTQTTVHLSIAKEEDVISDDMAEMIAKAFGLGARSSWTFVIPPAPPQICSYHIFKNRRS